MPTTRAYAALTAKTPLEPFTYESRQPGPIDVEIQITHCGVCHSDLHQARDEWGGAIFPMVPGHEIVGLVTRVGVQVKQFKIGDRVGVGCMVDSCQTCVACSEGLEQYCADFVPTYNSHERDGVTPTYGGYAERIVVRETFVVRVPEGLDSAAAAPLLCAGITTYSPLRHWKAGPGKKVGVVGLGGLGHMAVKIAVAMGAEVTVFTTSESKVGPAHELGAKDVIVGLDKMSEKSGEAYHDRFDLILDTAAADHDINRYVKCLRRDGTLVVVGLPENPHQVEAFPLVLGRRSIAGSLIGGIRETQEMLDFCARHRITADIEVIRLHDINSAYERMIRGDVRYRFVIDVRESLGR